MQLTTTKKLIRLDYDNKAELKAIRPSERNEGQADDCRHTAGGRGALVWWGCEGGVDEAIRLCEHGWADGLAKLNALAAKIESKLPRLKNKKRRARRGRQGDELCIHAVNSGNLDRAWRYTERFDAGGMAKTKRVRIVLQIGGLADVTAQEMFYPPAAGLIVAQQFIKAGWSVEIVAASAVDSLISRRNERQLTTIKLKAFDQPLNIDALASTALAGFFRHYVFQARCSLEQKINQSMGYTCLLRDEWFKANDAKTIIIQQCYSEELALDAINGALATVKQEKERHI